MFFFSISSICNETVKQLTINHVFLHDIMNFHIVKRKIRRHLPPYIAYLLLTERLTVGTLIHGGISLMGANQDSFQRTEVCILAVMGALLNSTLDALVCMAIHRSLPPFRVIEAVCPWILSFILRFHWIDAKSSLPGALQKTHCFFSRKTSNLEII